MIEERFIFSSRAKAWLMRGYVAGFVLVLLGALLSQMGHDPSHIVGEGAHGEGGGHPSMSWYHRLFTAVWTDNLYFLGIALGGVLFFAIQYAAQVGWSATVKRVALAMGGFLPLSSVLLVLGFFFFGSHLFHWTHHELYDPASPAFDSILDGKKGYFFWPSGSHPNIPWFFLFRMLVFLTVWQYFYRWFRRLGDREDMEGGTLHWRKLRTVSAVFIVFFAVSSSIAAWDWVLSIDTHWFSTMIGWYVFSSWWVGSLAMFTLLVVLIKENTGLLGFVNSNHLHDLGKFVFAFSIFWTYIWFSQFLLIYYANIPEESIYFVERWMSGTYSPWFYSILFLNFVLPFLLLLTRDSKRTPIILKVVCVLVILGHWLDFHLMTTPGTLGQSGGIGLIEIGVLVTFLCLFLWTTMAALGRSLLVAKNHPLLEESLQHHV